MKKYSLIILMLYMAACTKTSLPAEPTVYEDALIILNEGAFTGGTATLDAVGGSVDTIVQSAFSTENGYALGNIGQHMILAAITCIAVPFSIFHRLAGVDPDPAQSS